MTILVNNQYKFNVPNDLIVKDGKLYNPKALHFEGVEADMVEFDYTTQNNQVMTIKGVVEGFTNGGKITLRGRDKTYEGISKYTIDHVSSVAIVDSLEDEELAIASSE